MNDMGDTFELNVVEKAIKEGKKVLLFWYPKDFTFVCPTELHAFQAALPEFEKRNTIVIGASAAAVVATGLVVGILAGQSGGRKPSGSGTARWTRLRN